MRYYVTEYVAEKNGQGAETGAEVPIRYASSSGGVEAIHAVSAILSHAERAEEEFSPHVGFSPRVLRIVVEVSP